MKSKAINLVSCYIALQRRGREHTVRPMLLADGACLSVQASPSHPYSAPRTITPGIEGWQLVEVSHLCGLTEYDLELMCIWEPGPGPWAVNSEALAAVCDMHGGIVGRMRNPDYQAYLRQIQ